MAVIAAVVVALAGNAGAAEISNPSAQLPQPTGAKRFYTQHEIRMLLTYRLADLSRVDHLEFAGGDAGAGAGAGAGDSGSSGASSGGNGGCR